MALIVQGGLAALTSGRIGNTVFARNRGGAYVRNYVRPVNPATAAQVIVRAAHSSLVAGWSNQAAVDVDQQQAFADYSVANPQPNRVGLTTVLPPLSMYLKMNMPRQLNALPLVADPPTGVPLTIDWNQGAFGVTGTIGGQPQVAFGAADWVDQDDAACLVFISPPQSVSKYFYKGKYNFAGSILGDGTTAPTSPATLGSAPTLVAGRYFYRAYVTMANGQIGAEVTGFFDAA